MNPDEHTMLQWPPPGGEPRPHEKVAGTGLSYESGLPFLVKQAANFVAARFDMSKIAAAEAPSNIWRDPDAHPMILIMKLIDLYGDEVMEWDGGVLRVTLGRDGRQPSGSVWTKIQAARVLMNSPSPWRQWEVLHWVALGLAGDAPNFVYFEESELGHLAAAVEMMNMVDPTRETSEEVDKFIATVLRHEGFAWAPPPLDIAQRELEDRKLRCLDCDAIHRDDNDVRCISCGSVRLEAEPYAFAELRDETARLFKKYLPEDLPTAERELPETAAGVSVYRLLEHWAYVEDVQHNLAEQLKVLKA